MKIGRIFANAIARRVAYVLVAMALAWLGLSDAKAACAQDGSPSVYRCATEGEARSAAMAFAGANYVARCAALGGGGPGEYGTAKTEAGYWQPGWHCVSPYPPNPVLGTWYDAPLYYWNLSCSGKPNETFSHDLAIPTGSSGCKEGCEFDVTNNGDGTYTRYYSTAGGATCSVLPECTTPGWYLNHVTSMCQPPEVECPSNQVKNPKTKQCEEACPTGMVMDATGACKPSTDDCPAGNVRSPSGQCLPGEGQCAAGEARRPNGTCGRDSDGDGQADEDDEDPDNDPERETASGGDSCSAPPSCSGGPIDCLQAKIQWRIDCNTRHKVNVTGGACGAMPVCVGENCKAMEYAQLLQQWKAACSLEKLANSDGGGEGGNNADLIALLTGPGSINGEHGDTGGMPGGDGPFQWGEGEEHEPDTAGFGYGSSCPSPPSFTVGGRTISIDLTIMCQWVSLAGSIVLILAGLASVRIVSGGIA